MGDFAFFDNVSYGAHERQVCDIYIPKSIRKKSGFILYIHGGGWQDGDKSIHHKECEYFSSLGYICATMNYRFVSEEWDVFCELDDIADALTKIKQVCAEYDCDVKTVLLSGGSAGGHLALMYAYTRRQDSPVDPVAVCPFCPPVDCAKPDFLIGLSGEFEEWKYSIISKCCGCNVTKDTLMNGEQQEALRKMSPCEYVSGDCVPTAVFYGEHDELIPLAHTEEFVALLRKNGVKNDTVVYKNSGHALDKDPDKGDRSRGIISEYAERYL